jgi:hypothetical protein
MDDAHFGRDDDMDEDDEDEDEDVEMDFGEDTASDATSNTEEDGEEDGLDMRPIYIFHLPSFGHCSLQNSWYPDSTFVRVQWWAQWHAFYPALTSVNFWLLYVIISSLRHDQRIAQRCTSNFPLDHRFHSFTGSKYR